MGRVRAFVYGFFWGKATEPDGGQGGHGESCLHDLCRRVVHVGLGYPGLFYMSNGPTSVPTLSPHGPYVRHKPWPGHWALYAGRQ
jgi:hypothetical protein